MSMHIRFEHPGPDEISKDLTSYLQEVALRGWKNVLQHRSYDELLTQFNPWDADHLNDTQGIYKQYAAHEGLVIAYAPYSANPVGYALATYDVSGNVAARFVKRHFMKDKTYAWLRHVCIDAPYQRQGISGPLVAEVLDGQQFRPEQVPTAYIFEENVAALCALTKFGFKLDPNPQEPKVLEGHFGDEIPVYQWRYTGESVEQTIAATRA